MVVGDGVLVSQRLNDANPAFGAISKRRIS